MARYDFYEDRNTYVREQLKEVDDTGAKTGKDISSSDYKVYFRAFVPTTPDTVLINTELSKIVGTSTAGDTGKFGGNIKFASKYQKVVCRYVLVDESSADASAYSSYTEFVLLSWEEVVHGSPQP